MTRTLALLLLLGTIVGLGIYGAATQGVGP